MALKRLVFSDELSSVGSGTYLGLGGGTLTGGIEIDRSSDPFVRVTDGTKTMYSGYITSTSGMMGTTTNHPLEIRTNNTARLTFANSGEATFGGNIRVQDSSTANVGLELNYITGSNRGDIGSYDWGNSAWKDTWIRGNNVRVDQNGGIFTIGASTGEEVRYSHGSNTTTIDFRIYRTIYIITFKIKFHNIFT